MKLVVNNSNNHIIEFSEPSLEYHYFDGRGTLCFWGTIFLFKDKIFRQSCLDSVSNMSFDSIIPLLTGRFVAARINNDKLLELSTDFYGHTSAFVYRKKNVCVITDDIDSISFDEPIDYDRFQIRHFIDKGYCWAGGTFFKQLTKISPTITFRFDSNGIEEVFQPFPTFIKNGTLDQCMANTLKAITQSNKKVGLFFSSGVDSSYIREVALQNEIRITPLLHYMTNPHYYAPEEDHDLAMRMNEGRGDIVVCEMTDGDEHFAKTIEKTVHLLPFDFHPALIPSQLYPFLKEEGFDMAISGQNSDSVYAMAATHHIPVSKTLKQILTFHIHHSGLKGHFKRYLQTGRFLKGLQKGKPVWWAKKVWIRINPDYEFTFSNLLMAYLKDDTELPVICHNKEDKLEAEYIKQYQHFVEKLNPLLERGESPRMVMIRGKLLGHCQGRDVRCLTEWAKECGVGNIQVFTSGPILSWLGTHELGLFDVFIGKRKLRSYLEKKIHYSKLKELVPDYRNDPGMVSSEKQRFRDMYYYVNKDHKMDLLCKEACEFLYNYEIISKEEYEYYSQDTYSDNKPRLVWLDQSIRNLLGQDWQKK